MLNQLCADVQLPIPKLSCHPLSHPLQKPNDQYLVDQLIVFQFQLDLQLLNVEILIPIFFHLDLWKMDQLFPGIRLKHLHKQQTILWYQLLNLHQLIHPTNL